MLAGGYAILALVMILVSGCATVGQDLSSSQDKLTADVTTALANLSKFTVADLTAAAADAKAHNDPEAEMCWNGLLPIVQSIGTGGSLPTIPKIIGGASLFQAIRDVLQGGAGLSGKTPLIVKQINMACGPLYVSARADILKVLVMVGVSAGGGPGVGGIVGHIPSSLAPAIGSILKLPIQP